MRNYILKTLFLLSMLPLLSCAQGDTQPEVLQIQGFESFVTKFENYSVTYNMPVKVTNLIIQFGTLQTTSERGLCEVDGTNTPTITIDQDAWQQLDEPSQETILFHELGHCVLRRTHVEAEGSDGVPTSLMYPYTIDGATYLANQDAFLTELFSERGDF